MQAHTTSLGLLVAALLLAAPAAAGAAPPWSAPTAPAAGLRVTAGPSLAFGSDGAGLLTAGTSGRFGDPATVGRFRAFTLTPSLRAIDRGTLAEALATEPLVFARDRVVLVQKRTMRRATQERQGRVRLSAAFGTTDRPAGHTRTLAEFTGSEPPAVAAAANDRGEVAVAWTEGATYEGVRLRLALRRPGRGFSAPSTIARGVGIADVAVALGARGDLLVVYNRARSGRERGDSRAVVETRVRRAGRAFGRARRLGESRGVDRFGASVAPSGRMAVAWATNDPGEEIDEPIDVRAAIRPAGARPFGAPQLLEAGAPTGGSAASGQVLVRVARDGRATVGFSTLRRAPAAVAGARTVRPVRVSSAGASGRFAGPQTLAPDGTLGGLAVSGDGTVTVAWTGVVADAEGDPAIGPLAVASRSVGEVAFGAAEAVSAPEAAVSPALALSAAGTPALAWATDPFAPSARLRLSRRDRDARPSAAR